MAAKWGCLPAFIFLLLIYNANSLSELDVEAVHREAGLKPFKLVYPTPLDYCEFNHSDAKVLRVFCPSTIYCKVMTIRAQNPEPNSIHKGSVSDLWNDCRYKDGRRQFHSQIENLIRLNGTIEELVMGNNHFDEFVDGYFCQLANLKTLDLSDNDLNDFAKIGLHSEPDCAENNCCLCGLKQLILTENNFEMVYNDSFCQLEGLAILKLDLCNITTIESGAFMKLTNMTWVDLSGNKLTTLPDGLFQNNTNLWILDLSNNQLDENVFSLLRPLTNLRNLALHKNRIDSVSNFSSVLATMPNLTFLSLGYNSLTTFGDELSSLSGLQQLDLSNNRLTTLSTSFHSLQALTVLDLSKNRLQHLEADVFHSLINLEKLSLFNNELRSIPKINNLVKLKRLNLQSNWITSLIASDFINVTRLTHVDLSLNSITYIESGTFEGIIQLTNLDLTKNELTKLNRTFINVKIFSLKLDSNHLNEFSFSDISPYIENLSAVRNRISTLNSTEFALTLTMTDEGRPHQPWSLTSVDFSYNRLVSLDKLLLPPSVKTFTARNNRILKLSYHPVYIKMRDDLGIRIIQLERVRLENNDFRAVCEAVVLTRTLVSQVSYYFNGNPLRCSCENSWMKRLKELTDSRAPFFGAVADLYSLTCRPAMGLAKYGTPSQPTNLMQLDTSEFLCPTSFFSNKRCECTEKYSIRRFNLICHFPCPDRCFCFSNHDFSIVHLYCSRTEMTKVPRLGDQEGITAETQVILWLDGNEFPKINSTDFAEFPNLAQLYLNNSKVNSIDAEAFSELLQLEILHLEDNHLQILPMQLFSKLTKLREIYISNNYLTSIPDDIFHPLQSLGVLELHNNFLTNFSVWKLEESKNLSHVTLHENPWSCECDFIEQFRNYLQNHSHDVQSINKVFCTEDNGTLSQVPLINFNSSRCYDAVILTITTTTIWVSVLTTFVFITISVLLAFYFRHEMQVFIYSRYGVRIFARRGTENNAGKVYDAFIAYSSDDVDFLFYKMLPNLEQIDRPYRLCIHERDFMPGAYINDSIVEAVERSCRTIVLLTENFVKSNWCRFEFKTAHLQMIHDRCPRVLVIVVDQIPTDLDPEMKLYLKTNTYLKWDEKLFWKKFHYSMPDRRVSEPAQEVVTMSELNE